MDEFSAADPVVITGVGMVTPLAGDREGTWRRVLAGTAAARRLRHEDAHPLPERLRRHLVGWIGCPADRSQVVSPDPLVDLALRASREAIADSGWRLGDADSTRMGCVFGTSKGSLCSASQLYDQLCDASEKPSAAVATMLGPAVSAQAVAADFGLCGPVICPVAACATGVAAVLRAADLIRHGDCDIAIAGSADDSLHPLVLASFQRLGVLATSNDPAAASRPFDRHRRGFVIGAGAGCVILERRSHALQRGKAWYATVGPGRLMSDPTGMTTLDASGNVLARMIADCSAPFSGTDQPVPDVVNLHGTGTRQNDPAECRALRQVFGDRLDSSSCGSLKGGLGHLLGAAGSVELGLCCLMLRDQLVPPNVNLEEADPDCQLPWVRREPARRGIASLLKLSLGFGGHQAALWLHRGTRDSDFSQTEAT